MIIGLRILAAIGCLAAGMFASCRLYCASDGGGSNVLDFLPLIGVAGLISFTSFSACRAFLQSRVSQVLLGGIGSYLAMLVALLIVSLARGELAQTKMWMPIILLFGIPFLAPVVSMSGLAAFLMWPRRES